MSREDRKAEEALKALLRLPANKRCVNCDALGPQYVVSAFNVFVCTVCSGVHRQFGHRVKGVSMSTFKADEVAVLKESGNEKFAAFFLNKWTSAALPKPVEREAPRIQAWITAVYQDRRFYAEPASWAPSSSGAGTPSRSAAGSTTASEAGEPSMRPLHEVLGSDTPKLQVQHSGDSRHLERAASAASSSAGAATPTRSATAPPPAAGTAAARELNLLDASSPKSAKSAPPPAAAAPAAWDPFGAASPTAAAAPAPAAPPAAAAPAAQAGWASFGDAAGPAEQQQQQQQAAAAAPVAPAAEGTTAGGWEAFGDAQPAAAPAPAAAVAKPAAAAVPVAVPGAAAAPAAAAAGASATTSASNSPSKQQQQQPKQPVRSASRPEVPMDVFFPEFEQIRATGMLPNGQPVPLPAFPPSYAGAAPRGAGPAAVAPYAAYSYPAGGPAQQRPAGAYAAPPRPTIAIPPAPLHPGGLYGGPSPGAYHPGAPSPNPYSSPSLYSPGSLPSPAGSAFSGSSQPGAAPSNGGYGGPLAGGLPDLRSSTGSLGELLPGSAAPTPAGAAVAAHDPFAGLAPGLRAALPAVPSGPGAGGKWGTGAPPPTPAGGPPFANGGGVPSAAFPSAGPFSGALAPSPAGLSPATAAASATLFGRTPSLTGYDLSAPAAPKPQPSGNPFA
ncbi:hypothetical protein ABPG75_005058 [Micractinium tetrahymenae]